MSARNFYIMQSAVAPMQSETPCYTPLTNHRTEVHTVPLVMAADYDALEAECERLRQSMLRLVTMHCAAAMKNNATDAELEQYLSAGIAQLEAERDALRQQRDKLAGLLRKVLATHKRWPDLAPSLSLCADIKATLSEPTP